mmetsp:Transcript_126161/g.353273  ORF Transcript_126161/g.353273 Transcript_126161/m.353273 type:complete len:216 (+) Transcript_126161:774-1421(+)
MLLLVPLNLLKIPLPVLVKLLHLDLVSEVDLVQQLFADCHCALAPNEQHLGMLLLIHGARGDKQGRLGGHIRQAAVGVLGSNPRVQSGVHRNRLARDRLPVERRRAARPAQARALDDDVRPALRALALEGHEVEGAAADGPHGPPRPAARVCLRGHDMNLDDVVFLRREALVVRSRWLQANEVHGYLLHRPDVVLEADADMVVADVHHRCGVPCG